MQADPEASRTDSASMATVPATVDYQREMEMCKREKELAERELALARAELQLLRGTQGPGMPDQERRVEQDPMIVTSKLSITAIADLLGHFNGSTGDYENWERQLTLLRRTYELTEGHTKVLISMRLKGKALEWFHSDPARIESSVDDLLCELREMFDHRPSRIELRKTFEQRVWQKGETFHEYVHAKTILANRASIDKDEVLDYIIDGIPITSLRDQARIGGFTTKASLLRAFEKVNLRERFPANATRKTEATSGGHRQGAEKTDREKPRNEKRCFNCGQRNHMGSDCPTKSEGPKCFSCGERGHLASKCKQQKTVSNTNLVMQDARKKYMKEVSINNRKIEALIDTGSDICLMRADQHIEIGAPKLRKNKIQFRGIGSGDNITSGEFSAIITIDNNDYPIVIHVISDTLMKHSLLIGADFLDTVQITISAGNIAVNAPKLILDNKEFSEICQISSDFDEINGTDVTHIPDIKHKNAIQNLIEEYEPKKTRDVGLKMTILLKDDEPVYQRARRLSPLEREKVNVQINEWIREGIAQPSLSEYASPIVLAKKKDGSTRLCVDYRLLNKKIIKDRYPLPLVEDQLDLLQGARYFSTLDLKNGFFHVPVDEQSRKFTAFIVPDGHYEFLRVPFGLCNSPAVFQRYINIVFRDLIQSKVILTYMDDLIIPSIDCEIGIKNLQVVLKVASEAGLTINWRKCQFLRQRVEFLGHVIENGRVGPSEHKTEAVRKFPEPNSVKQVQSFLGLSGYFRKFVPQYSVIARPLTNLLKAESKFEFGEKERESFTRLKEILCGSPVLKLYIMGAETELHTDASMHGYGAILLQRNKDDDTMHPVYYYSGKTTPAEEKYTSYELEVLAIIKAIKKFRVYLLGVPFKIVTDCRAFMATMNKKDLCVRVARWALLLEEFSYIIEHRPGKNMTHVDALSRYPLPQCMLVNTHKDGLLARLEKAQQSDADVKKIFHLAKAQKIDGYAIRGDILFKEIDGDLRIVVPTSLRSQIIRQAHERGHFSVMKTEALINKEYWIPNLRDKIQKVIKNCIPCILAERKQGKQEGFLNPIAKGEIPLDTYHIDHLGPLPSTKKSYNHIFLVIDSFSKFTWLYSTKTTSTAEVINILRKQSVVFGNPRRIISDRGTAFTSNDFRNYCKEENIEHVLTTTGIPRANGQAERVNRTLIPLLTKLADPKREEWYKYLGLAQQCLNTTLHRGLGTSPFNVLFGTQARLRDNYEIRELLEKEWISKFQEDRDEIRDYAKENIAKIQKENKHGFDKKRKKATSYCENDLVAVKRTQQGPGLKLANKYLGPYRIIKALRNDRYVVRKIGDHEGPWETSTAADYMKPWANETNNSSDDEEPCGSEVENN